MIGGDDNGGVSVREKLKLFSNTGLSIDWLMGHDFGHIKIGAKQGVAPELYLLKKMYQFGSYGGGSGRNGKSRRDPAYSLALKALDTRRKDAFVKLIANGGTSNGTSMKAQMEYLSRDGEEEIVRSEQFMGSILKAEEREDLVEAWGLNLPNRNNTERTSHFVVSFPIGTDREAADRAARAWAGELFDSGKYGDVYDYYTVTHKDTDHPHTHVVVNRRGLHNGQWLKVSKRSVINYNELRHVQVEVAAKEGIALKALPRAAMGKTERPLTSAEVRRAGREGRTPISRPYNEAGALEAAAKVFYYTSQMRFEGHLLEERYPQVAKAITRLTQGLREGQSVSKYLHDQDKKLVDDGRIRPMERTLEDIREKVVKEFQELDMRVQKLPEDSRERAEIERQIADNKLRVAPFIEAGNYVDVDVSIDNQGRYRGVYADDEVGKAIKNEADAKVRVIAQKHGLNPDVILARYDSAKPATLRQADRWRAQEERAVSAAGGAPSAVTDAHTEIAQIYGRARDRLLDHRNLKQAILKDAATPDEPKDKLAQTEASLKRVSRISEAITKEQRSRLEKGDVTQLSGITKDPRIQLEIGRQYLEAALELSGGEAREALERTQGSVKHQTTEQNKLQAETNAQKQLDQKQTLNRLRLRSRSRRSDGFDL
ncbi:MAG: relaxase/mobilization nuclease domain-containing protein [Pseudomonadota bacterium]